MSVMFISKSKYSDVFVFSFSFLIFGSKTKDQDTYNYSDPLHMCANKKKTPEREKEEIRKEVEEKRRMENRACKKSGGDENAYSPHAKKLREGGTAGAIAETPSPSPSPSLSVDWFCLQKKRGGVSLIKQTAFFQYSRNTPLFF